MTPSTERSAPWWSHGYVWLVISGPAAVIVAGFVTVWLAVRTPDPVVDEHYYRRGLEINKTLAAEKSLLPALKARNHAATQPAEPQ